MAIRIWCFAAFALYIAVLAGCSNDEDVANGTRGELGHVVFNYQRSCFFGCSLAQPLLAGTREQIELSDAGDAEGVSVESSDADVASFALERSCYCERSDSTDRLEIREDASCPSAWRKHCDNSVLVAAADSGEAQLELRDAHHELIDRVSVIVHEAHDARFAATLPDKLGPVIGSHFELENGKSLDLALTLYDEAGLALLAPEGVDWHVDDVMVATLSAFLTGSGADLHDGLDVSVHATGPGDTQVHVSVPGLDTSVELHVTE
jgi:hypothetical protein